MMANIAYTDCFRQLYYASLGNYRKIFISEASLFSYARQLRVYKDRQRKTF